MFRQLTAKARKALPGNVISGLRSLWHRWAMLTARWRMLPDFVVIGAQRAGTTTLFRVLNDHPEVARPTISKGIGYFDVHYARGPVWYRAHFPLRFIADLSRSGRAKTFESSGYYSFHPLAAERIARDLPGVRVVMMVRDPAERAYSAFKHESSRGFEQASFSEALALEPDRLAGEVEKIATDPSYQSYEHRHHAYVSRSQYAPQVQRFIDHVGEDRVYLVDADRFFAEPETELAALFAFLGLSPWQPDKVEQWNARPSKPMDPELRAELMSAFAESDDRLAALMGRTPTWRQNVSA